jgi:hypothetical protein
MAYDTDDIITWAKISQYLSEKDIIVSGAINGGRIDKRLPQMLYTERKSLEWRYSQNSSDTSLFDTGNYVLSLCGKYLMQAQQISGGGGTVVNATQPSALVGIVPKHIEFVVGDGSALIANGSRTLTITDNNIKSGSVEIHVSTGELSKNLVDRLSYTEAYSSTGVVITMNENAVTGQAFIIDYYKTVGISASSSSSTRPDPIYYFADGTEGVTLTLTDLYGFDIGMLFRDGRPYAPTSGTPINQQYTFDNNTVDGNGDPAGTIVFPAGTDLVNGEPVFIIPK